MKLAYLSALPAHCRYRWPLWEALCAQLAEQPQPQPPGPGVLLQCRASCLHPTAAPLVPSTAFPPVSLLLCSPANSLGPDVLSRCRESCAQSGSSCSRLSSFLACASASSFMENPKFSWKPVGSQQSQGPAALQHPTLSLSLHRAMHGKRRDARAALARGTSGWCRVRRDSRARRVVVVQGETWWWGEARRGGGAGPRAGAARPGQRWCGSVGAARCLRRALPERGRPRGARPPARAGRFEKLLTLQECVKGNVYGEISYNGNNLPVRQAT